MAREMKELKEEEAPEQVPKKRRFLWKGIVIGLVVLVVLGAAGAGVLVYLDNREARRPALRPVIGTLWAMEPFIVNLTDNGGERYLKAVIQLEVSQPATVTELEQLRPKLRDSVLDLLSAKSYQDLMDTAGKQRLREEIITRLNSFLTSGRVDRIYFTDLVVQ